MTLWTKGILAKTMCKSWWRNSHRCLQTSSGTSLGICRAPCTYWVGPPSSCNTYSVTREDGSVCQDLPSWCREEISNLKGFKTFCKIIVLYNSDMFWSFCWGNKVGMLVKGCPGLACLELPGLLCGWDPSGKLLWSKRALQPPCRSLWHPTIFLGGSEHHEPS